MLTLLGSSVVNGRLGRQPFARGRGLWVSGGGRPGSRLCCAGLDRERTSWSGTALSRRRLGADASGLRDGYVLDGKRSSRLAAARSVPLSRRASAD